LGVKHESVELREILVGKQAAVLRLCNLKIVLGRELPHHGEREADLRIVAGLDRVVLVGNGLGEEQYLLHGRHGGGGRGAVGGADGGDKREQEQGQEAVGFHGR
jgi:hypothetical protein